MVLTKIGGGLSILFGLFLMFGVPFQREFQPVGLARTSIIIGLFFLVLGIYLMTI